MAQVVVGSTARRAKWTVGGIEATQALVTGDFPVSQAASPEIEGTVSSDPITTQPNGQPWDWAAITALADMKLELDYAPDGSSRFMFNLLDCWIEVYGPLGGVGPPVQIPLKGKIPISAEQGVIGNVTLRGAIPTIRLRGKTLTNPLKIP